MPPVAAAPGFTLIELMVVVTIVAVLSVGALLGFGGGSRLLPGARGADPAAEGQRLVRTLARARDMALFGRQSAGLRPLAAGWQVALYDPAQDSWRTALSIDAEGVSLAWRIAGTAYAPTGAGEEALPPPIRVLPDGRMTPFSLRFGSGRASLTCSGERLGELRCAAP